MSRTRKALTASLGVVAMLAAAGLPSPYQEIAQAVLAVATALGVYAVPNALTQRQEVALLTAPPAEGEQARRSVRRAVEAVRGKL